MPRLMKFSVVVLGPLFLVTLLMGAAQAEDENVTYTGCLNAGGNIINVAIGDTPARPCKGNQTQITWTAGTPLNNVQCDPGLVVTGFDENGLPICDCPFGIVPDFVDEDEHWSVSNVSIDGGSNTAIVTPGSTFTVSLDYTHLLIGECPGCIIQFQLGFSHLDPEDCLLPFGTAPLEGDGSTEFTAPTRPGIYYIEVRRTLELFCLETWENTQGSGVNWPRYRVAAICVK